ncbi:MAG: VOC family protein [Trueperaceae bacterium]
MASLVLDHAILAGPALPELVAAFTARTGVPATPGGRHAGQGTHNALVGLGPGRYLELLAPDPDADDGPFRASIAYLDAPALHTWCVRGGGADAFEARVRAAGLAPRRVAMARTRPDGVRLAWELVFVEGHAFGGSVPFFIDWGGSAHPSGALGAPLDWRSLRLEHPDAARLAALLGALGGVPDGVRVEPGTAPRLVAAWRGPGGDDVWDGRGGPA